jgi:hypothetical protein
MKDKVKTSIIIDRKLWEEFKSKVASERGLKGLSQAVEEAIEDEVSEVLIIKTFEDLLKQMGKMSLTISPVRPRVTTDAGKAVREMRKSRS